MAPTTLQWTALGIGVALNALANILIKAAALGQDGGLQLDRFWGWVTDPYLLTGIASFALALGFYAYALTGVELSVAYPIMTTIALVIVFLWSVTVYQEELDAAKIAGTALTIVGVVLLAQG